MKQRGEDERTLDVKSREGAIPVIEERVVTDKNIIETGSVRIKKEVEEKDVMVDAQLTGDVVEVKRIPVNRPLSTAPPPVRYEGDTMIISVVQEEIVVQRRLVLTEEIYVTKKKTERTIHEPVTIRKEKVSFWQDSAATHTRDKDNSNK